MQQPSCTNVFSSFLNALFIAHTPVILHGTLRLHQIEGVNFLLHSFDECQGGAILADELGLGKSIIVISYLAFLKVTILYLSSLS